MIKSKGIRLQFKKLFTKEFLIQEYSMKKKSTLLIAKENNTTKTTILKYLKKFNIERRIQKGENHYNYTDGWSYKKHYCIDCGKEIKRHNAIRCKSCVGKYRWSICPLKIRGSKLENNGNWQGGKSFEEYPIEFNEQLREQIRKRDNYTCKNCGMIEEEHLIVYGRLLHVHHIDYDKKNCVEGNLITLCISCNVRANSNKNNWLVFYQNKIRKLYKLEE